MTVIATTTPASRRALTTVERYREIMPETEILNAKLETLIGQASAAIETYLGRKLARERVTERLRVDGGTAVLFMERRPLVTIHGITLGGDALASDRWSAESPDAGMIRLEAGPNALWNELVGDYGAGNYGYRGGTPQQIAYEVDHTAGYLVPGQTGFTGEPALPQEIEAACQIAVQAYLEAADRPAGITSERLGDASWSYAQGAVTRGFITADVQALLTPYRLIVI